MDEAPPKFLVVHTREDRPMTDTEPRMVEAHGYTEQELAEVLATYNHFEIGGRRFRVVDKLPGQLKFTMQLVEEVR